jgi:hypothetical protein
MKRLPAKTKELLSPFFPSINLDRVILIDRGLIRLILPLIHANGITFGHRIYLADELNEDIIGIRLIGHELTHVKQYHEKGFFGLMIKYLFDYLGNRLKGKDRYASYMNISFEREAYVMEARIYREMMDLG